MWRWRNCKLYKSPSPPHLPPLSLTSLLSLAQCYEKKSSSTHFLSCVHAPWKSSSTHMLSCVHAPWQALLHIVCSFWLSRCVFFIWRSDMLQSFIMMWPSFWYHFCATLPLEMRTVGLVLFLQAFALLCCLCCTVHLPSSLLTRCSALLCAPTVQPMFSSVSVDRMPTPTYPHATPTPSHRRYTRQDLLDVGSASSSSAGPLFPLLIACLRHLGLACNQPRKPQRSRRGGRKEPRKISVWIDGSDKPVHPPPVDSISTQPDLQHHSSHPDTTTATVIDAKSLSSSYSHHQKQGNLICINPSQNDKGLTVSVFNAQSVGPKEKHTEIVEFMKDECVDILFLTETWMKTHGDESKCVDLTPPGYKLRSFPRATRGGGLAVIYRDHFPVTVSTTFPFTHTSFELVQLQLTAPHHIHFFCLYRPPPSRKNKLTDTVFLSKFPDFLEYCNTLRGKLIILGDFNIHFDSPSDPLTSKALQIITTFDIFQGVEIQPTAVGTS